MYLVYSVTSLLLFLSICLNVLLVSTTIAFFLFSFLPSPRTFLFSPFLFLRYCDFGASRVKKPAF